MLGCWYWVWIDLIEIEPPPSFLLSPMFFKIVVFGRVSGLEAGSMLTTFLSFAPLPVEVMFEVTVTLVWAVSLVWFTGMVVEELVVVFVVEVIEEVVEDVSDVVLISDVVVREDIEEVVFAVDVVVFRLVELLVFRVEREELKLLLVLSAVVSVVVEFDVVLGMSKVFGAFGFIVGPKWSMATTITTSSNNAAK